MSGWVFASLLNAVDVDGLVEVRGALQLPVELGGDPDVQLALAS